jgi:hypothetical protein
MRALIEQWKRLEPPPTIGRDAERAALIETLRHPGNIVEVVARSV